MPAQVVKDAKEKDIQITSSSGERKASVTSENVHPEITERDREAEVHVEGKLQESIGGDARVGDKQEIPGDLKDVIASPQDEASDVLKKGSTIVLPISKASYERGLLEKDEGAVINKEIVGTKSIIGAVTRAGRLIKMFAHSTVKKVMFKKGETENAN